MGNEEIKKLKKEIARLRQAIKKQKYGLHWLDVPEAFENDAENKVPIPIEIEEKSLVNDDKKPTHILFEGDNYHALTCLNYTHKEKIDVIYIDPPYNTGKDGFKYIDKRLLGKYPDGTPVPVDSPFRHSYWLSFLRKRLELAKPLLKRSGVIFVSIDDNEVAQLKLLMDSIFGLRNFVGIICQKSRDSISNDLIISQNHNFHLVYAKEFKIVFKNKFSFRFKKELIGFSNPDNDPNGPWKLSPVDGPGGERKGNPYFEFLGIKGYWRYSKKTMGNLYKKGELIKRSKSLGRKYYLKDAEKRGGEVPTTWWDNAGTTTEGTKDLQKIIGKNDFNNPKPVKLIKNMLKLASSHGSIVLDFFAGSGTTGQAVMELNEEDGGRRQFILVTNNENKIADKICYPRIKNLIKGYKFNGNQKKILMEKMINWTVFKNSNEIINEINAITDKNKETKEWDLIRKEIKNGKLSVIGEKKIKDKIAGLGGSVKYYKINFVGQHNIRNISDEDKIELACNANELLAIAENTLYEVFKNTYYRVFNNDSKYTAIYFREELFKFNNFVKEVKKLNKPTTVYAFSWGEDEFSEIFEYMKHVKVKSIPQPILEIYKTIYNLN